MKRELLALVLALLLGLTGCASGGSAAVLCTSEALPAGQARQRGRRVRGGIGEAGAGFKEAEGDFIDAPGQKAGVFGHGSGQDEGGDGQSRRAFRHGAGPVQAW